MLFNPVNDNFSSEKIKSHDFDVKNGDRPAGCGKTYTILGRVRQTEIKGCV